MSSSQNTSSIKAPYKTKAEKALVREMLKKMQVDAIAKRLEKHMLEKEEKRLAEQEAKLTAKVDDSSEEEGDSQ